MLLACYNLVLRKDANNVARPCPLQSFPLSSRLPSAHTQAPHLLVHAIDAVTTERATRRSFPPVTRGPLTWVPGCNPPIPDAAEGAAVALQRALYEGSASAAGLQQLRRSYRTIVRSVNAAVAAANAPPAPTMVPVGPWVDSRSVWYS
ncbi:hypothetical protein BJX63DRAFT_117899 [Aspergillus granulosus]|uniref:Uncharacterized protein n=1 Tax=Aspergillus granulosus TaxID=176169 RepID=A0ABR4HR31_9EURO